MDKWTSYNPNTQSATRTALESIAEQRSLPYSHCIDIAAQVSIAVAVAGNSKLLKTIHCSVQWFLYSAVAQDYPQFAQFIEQDIKAVTLAALEDCRG